LNAIHLPTLVCTPKTCKAHKERNKNAPNLHEEGNKKAQKRSLTEEGNKDAPNAHMKKETKKLQKLTKAHKEGNKDAPKHYV
jgi:hypothetical protein